MHTTPGIEEIIIAFGSRNAEEKGAGLDDWRQCTLKWADDGAGRPPADEAGGFYLALNRGNARQTIFRKGADYHAFERILSEGLDLYDVAVFSFQLLPKHWHLVLRPNLA